VSGQMLVCIFQHHGLSMGICWKHVAKKTIPDQEPDQTHHVSWVFSEKALCLVDEKSHHEIRLSYPKHIKTQFCCRIRIYIYIPFLGEINTPENRSFVLTDLFVWGWHLLPELATRGMGLCWFKHLLSWTVFHAVLFCHCCSHMLTQLF